MVSTPSGSFESLPEAPDEILIALRAVEERMTETSAELRALRLAIEARDRPAAERSAGAVNMTASSTLSIGAAIEGTGRIEASGEVGLADSVGITDALEVTMERGEPDASPEARSWIATVSKYAPVVGKVVEWAVRIYFQAN